MGAAVHQLTLQLILTLHTCSMIQAFFELCKSVYSWALFWIDFFEMIAAALCRTCLALELREKP